MAFREKFAWLSLGGILIAFGPYFLSLVVLGAAPWALAPASAARLIVAIGVLAVAMTIGAILLTLTNLRDAGLPSDERDLGIARRAAAVAYPILLTGIFLALGSLFFARGQAVLVNAVLAVIALTETTRCGIEIFGYRRGR